MSKRQIRLYLEDILRSIINIEEYIQDVSLSTFEQDKKTIDAVVRNVEIIGEATRYIPKDFIKDHNQIPWREMISMRNKVLHEYFGIDTEILWKTITEDLPPLKEKIKKLLV